jgi:DNA-directed RNA polymerase specialized sigma24 family protein
MPTDFFSMSRLFSGEKCYSEWRDSFFVIMSSIARQHFPFASENQEPAFFWIRPVDEKGFAVDQSFADAAYQKARDLRLYRAEELLDDAVRADLVEKAVYSASRVPRSEAVRDPKSYIYAIFARLVDERIAKERRVAHKPSSELDRFEVTSGGPKAAVPAEIEDAIFRRQVLAAMIPEDRWIWERRLLGYELEQIAAELNISPDCLSTRIRRGIDRVSKNLRLRRARQ